MLVSKQLADGLTWLRAFIAVSFIWLGFRLGGASLPLACWMLLSCWLTDLMDGPLARRSRRRYHTWIGDHDLAVDMLVSAGLLLFMMQTGYIGFAFGLVYFLAWGLYFWHFGVPRSMGMLVQAPVYFWFIWVALQEIPQQGYYLVYYLLAIVFITWPRFPKEVVPDFLRGMGAVKDHLLQGKSSH